MNFIVRIILSLAAGSIPCFYCLLSKIPIEYSLAGVFGTTTFALLGEYTLRKRKREINHIGIIKDLEFSLFVLEELKLIDLKYNKIIRDKLYKIEELLIGCRCVIDENNPSFRGFDLQVGNINMWASTFDNNEEFKTKEYKKTLGILRTFIQTELKKRK